MIHYIPLYLISVNAVGLFLMLADKIKAKRNHWRIREFTLLGVAAIGGSVGTLLGMYLFRHKTRHVEFAVGVPLIILAHAVIAIVCMSIFS